MNHADFSGAEISSSQLIEKLTHGWAAAHAGLALELIQRWATLFNTTVSTRDIREDAVDFLVDMGHIRLRSMDEVPCLFLSGDADLKNKLLAFWNKWNSPHHLPFILTLSDAAYDAARNNLKSDRCLIISRDVVKQLFRSAEPFLLLKRLLWQQIPKRALIPYDILVPAEGVVFVGRENELGRLLEEDSTSFAIAGPGRIGKTSLVKRYRKLRLLRHDASASRMFYISFYQCSAGMNGAARFLAMQIDGSSRSDRIKPGDLVNFLRYRKQVSGGLLDLTLDEVDDVCQTDTFKYLGEAARLGYCRLILCGRGALLKTLLHGNSPLGGRLVLIRLPLLSEEAARDLLLKPLTDLGFEFLLPDSLVQAALEVSGRVPHHIQMFGMKLAEMAISEQTLRISEDLLDKVKADFLLAQFFIKTLDEIKDLPTKLVGLKLLEAKQQDISVSFVQEIARREGLVFDRSTANDICIDLSINNVLAWDNGGFRLCTGGLSFYARETGYVKDALAEVRQKLASLASLKPLHEPTVRLS